MIKIIIEEQDAKFTPKQVGTRTVREQTGLVVGIERNAREFKFNLADSQSGAYPPGEYIPAPTSYMIGKYGRLEMNPFELKLVRLSEANKVKAA